MQNLYDFLYDRTFDVVDFLKYEVVNQKPELPEVPNKISINIHSSPSILWIDSSEYPGLFASGSNPIELWKSLNDAIYSYFGVPRYFAKKLGHKFSLPLPDGRAITERPKEQLAGA